MEKDTYKKYGAKHYHESLAIGSKLDRDWLKKDKMESPKEVRKGMIRRWRRKLKQQLSNSLLEEEN